MRRKLARVLYDVDASIEAWLGAALPAGVAVSFAAPGERGPDDRPALHLHLHLVREDADGSTVGWEELRDLDGALAARLPPDRRYRIVYLVTACAADVAVEHEVLGHFLLAAAAYGVLPEAYLRGSLVEDPRAILMRAAPSMPLTDPAALWAAWRIAPRAVLEFSLLVPMPRAPLTELAVAPREIDLRSERRAPQPMGAGPAGPRAAPRRRGTH